MSGPITFSGLSSGIDTGSIVTQLVNIEKQPMVNLQTQVQAAQTRQGILSTLSSQVSTLQNALSNLTTQSGIEGATATADSGAPFTATASSGAALGNYNIVVSQLAQTQRTYSNAFANASTAGVAGTGTLGLSMGGSSAKITISSSDSLNSIADKINNAGLPLSASVVYDGSQYRLVVNGESTGKANAITFDESGTRLGLNSPQNTVTAAEDAQVSLDGLSVTSATNTVTGIIPGVTLNLTGVSNTGYNLSVANDPTQLQTSLQAVATAYNAVMTTVNQQVPQAGSTAPLDNTTLVGDSAVQQLQEALLNATVTAGTTGTSGVSTLADLGLTVDQYGTMSLDTNQLQTVMSTQGSAVTSLLLGTNGTNGLASVLANTFQSFDDPVSGVLKADSQSIGDNITQMNNSIARMNDMATAYQQSLETEFSNMEQLISTYNSQNSALQDMMNLATNSNSNTSNSSSSSSSSSSGSSGSSGSSAG
jgi:flagellar hook-associated protein 2